MASSLTVFEKHQLQLVADEFIKQVRIDIKEKLISRKSPHMGRFVSTADTTGRLAASTQSEFTDTGIIVTALKYIGALQFGRRPGKFPPLKAIEDWLNAKGLDLNAWAVMQNMKKHGTTIWQEHAPGNSEIFEELNVDQQINELMSKLNNNFVSSVSDEIINTLAA